MKPHAKPTQRLKTATIASVKSKSVGEGTRAPAARSESAPSSATASRMTHRWGES